MVSAHVGNGLADIESAAFELGRSVASLLEVAPKGTKTIANTASERATRERARQRLAMPGDGDLVVGVDTGFLPYGREPPAVTTRNSTVAVARGANQ